MGVKDGQGFQVYAKKTMNKGAFFYAPLLVYFVRFCSQASK